MNRQPKRRGKRVGSYIGPIQYGVPVPRALNFGGLRERMTGLQPGNSFVTDCSRTGCYRMATQLGMKVIVRQKAKRLIRVWRINNDGTLPPGLEL